MQDWYVFYQRGGGSDELRSPALPSEQAALIQARSLELRNYVLRIIKPDGGMIDRSTVLDWIRNSPEPAEGADWTMEDSLSLPPRRLAPTQRCRYARPYADADDFAG